MKTIAQSQGQRSGVFIVSPKHIPQTVPAPRLLTLSRLMPAGKVLVDFKVNGSRYKHCGKIAHLKKILRKDKY